MKDWKKEFINKFCTFEGENRMVFKNKITADESLDFIEQIISERDKEILDIVKQHVIPETIFATVKAYPTEEETLAWDECATTARENLNDLRRHLQTLIK